ncbi:methylmalonyl-CoA/ethylmalonyl-CoA epimerase [Flavobacterium sp. 90]|uniref:VOC family protein n=1 Tax=unclassified Flavobacterium TaxID=196869 RepID=UPI000EAB65A3|nr:MULTISPECIES: VOC family protein [unclassified Flavobacterium]RKR09622.1 methylmalonyl-CoA/ethylmalonyl-CoA epimerase [Flavobacterium sp. 81]TCK53406.1 methylmalonyl-CoA/ethylmalonyl-CoA epimerase [Flavobacterium sp. 90]
MDLKFSHIDILVNDLQVACDYYTKIFKAEISKTFTWERDELHVTYAVVKMGQERFMLVQPFSGNLKDLLDTKGEGTIYRHCYSTQDIEATFDELITSGVQPEDENGNAISKEDLNSPSGVRIIWLPKRFGEFSIEILEDAGLQEFINEAFSAS